MNKRSTSQRTIASCFYLAAALTSSMMTGGCSRQEDTPGSIKLNEVSQLAVARDSVALIQQQAESAFAAMCGGQVPLINTIGWEYAWDRGPVFTTTVHSFVAIHDEMIRARLAQLSPRIPKPDEFMSREQNLSSYNSVVTSWEKEFVAFLDSVGFANFIDTFAIPLHKGNKADKSAFYWTIYGGELDTVKLGRIMRSSDASQQSFAAGFLGRYASYGFDQQKILFRVPTGPLADGIRNRGMSHPEQDSNLQFSENIPCSAALAKAIKEMDSTTVAVIAIVAEPFVLYHRYKLHVRFPCGMGWCQNETDDWGITVRICYRVRTFEIAGLNTSNHGKDKERILLVDLDPFVEKYYYHGRNDYVQMYSIAPSHLHFGTPAQTDYTFLGD